MIHPVRMTIANAYLVQGRRTIIVDSGAPSSEARILAALARHGITRDNVSLILLTHGHSDHAGSAAALRAQLGVPIALHAGDWALVERGSNGRQVSMGIEAVMSRPFVNKPFPAFTPDLVLDAGTVLAAYGVDARLLHTPGHSDGSITLLFDNGDAIAGDLLRGGVLGGTLLRARPVTPYFMPSLGSLPALRASLARVLAAGAQRWYVGHGGPLPRRAVERWLAAQRAPAQAAV
jgi:glyoxylase-like metal-dependent hydrolase (beta-lactamase superfamily II)